MKKIALAATLVLLIPLNVALAIPIDAHFTADNVIDAWFKDGSSPETIGVSGASNLSDWKKSDTLTVDLDSGHDWELIFQTENIGTAGTGNPGGFLAEIDYGPIYSDVSWKVAVVYDFTSLPDPSTDPTGYQNFWSSLNWENATEYGYNGESGIIWTNALGGPVPGISTNAKWIWDDLNFADSGAPEEGDSVFLKVQFHVPEPPTLLLLGAGFMFIAGFGRRRLLKKK